jgi:exodeoxyribonuclease VII small subunit
VSDEPSYGEAVAELEQILAALEAGAVDVDLLTDRVRRAAELLRWCRAKVDGARMEVERIAAELLVDPGPDGTADPPPGPGPGART